MKKKLIVAFSLLMVMCVAFYFYKSRHHNNVTASFYYWKSVYKISNEEKEFLDTLNVKRLYVKYFDVIWNPFLNQPAPEAIIKFATVPDTSIEIIPVIFIVNDVFKKSNPSDLDSLALHISSFIRDISHVKTVRINEIQFDCDWSDQTREKYFLFLKKSRKLFEPYKILLSATIRLHQVKYYQRTGIPPVQRGMLMFYNMGKLENTLTDNSIYDESVAKKYTDFIKSYPMQLDYALPVFTWGVHTRNNKVVSLVNNVNADDLDSLIQIMPIGENKFFVNDGFFFRGEYFLKGDIVRIEEVTPELALQAAKLLSGKINSKNFAVSLFHLDSSNIKRYAIKDFENIYHCFN